MSRTLAIAAITGLALCAVFLGLAFQIGGDDIFHDAGSMRGVKPLIDLATHKEWRWQGGDTLALDAPVNMRYQAKGAPRVSVTGPADMLAHVRVGDGRIASSSAPRRGGRKMEAVITGVPIRKFVVNGGENLQLGQIDQPALDLYINGSGLVTGTGRVSQFSLVISGPGKAELGGLAVSAAANVSILGNGTASLAPHGDLKLFIAGNGKLSLLSQPRTIRQTIIGNGEISRIAAEAAANNAAKSLQETVKQQVQQAMSHTMPPRDNAKDGAVMVRGRQSVDLGHVEQESLNITVANSGSVTAEGKVDSLSVNVLGSGNADLGKLAARTVNLVIAGSGNAAIAPGEDLKVTILGSGSAHLVTRPARIERSILGSGRIIEKQ